MKPASIARRTLLTVLLTGTTLASTGCSTGGISLASMNPFSRTANTPGLGTSAGQNQSIAANGSANDGAFKTVSTKAKGALGKTTNAFAGVFRRDKAKSGEAKGAENSDPLRLDNPSKKVEPEVFVANGQLWESTGDFSKAMESYTKALEKDANHVPALTGLARLHFRQGNLNDAVTYFNRAIVMKPNDAILHNDLGLTLSKLNNQPAAIASLQKALTLAPGTSRYANNLASVRYESGNPSAALSILMQNNKPAVAHFNMAYLFFKSGKMEQAKGHLAQSMKFGPQSQSDPATQRAVQRSRDMLAQIGGTLGPIAQARPQAKIAGGKVPGAPSYTAPRQPTRQAGSRQNSVATVVATTPATTSATASLPKNKVAAPTLQAQAAPAIKVATATSKSAPKTSIPTPKWNSWNRQVSSSSHSASSPAPIRPTSISVPSASTSPVKPATSVGFALPEKF